MVILWGKIVKNDQHPTSLYREESSEGERDGELMLKNGKSS